MKLRGGAIRVVGVLAAALVAAGFHLPMAATAAALPSAPRSVEADAAAGAVTVSWRRPLSSGAAMVNRYKVVRWANEVPRRAYKVSARKRSVTITGLAPGTTYSFKVLAHNARGWGKASKTVKAVPLPSGGDDGFGTIMGPCDVVAPQLDEPTPSLFANRFDFHDDPYDQEDLLLLTPGAREIYSDGGAGGSSLFSDMFAFETLARCEQASLVKTETEIVYDQPGAITDMSVEIASSKVGIGVTRAITFPPGSPPVQEDVTSLLAAKLDDIRESSKNVTPEDAWVKQILVVMAYDDMHAEAIETAWLDLDDVTKADTIVYVVVTDGNDACLYLNPC
jgi:hypothetical protein